MNVHKRKKGWREKKTRNVSKKNNSTPRLYLRDAQWRLFLFYCDDFCCSCFWMVTVTFVVNEAQALPNETTLFGIFRKEAVVTIHSESYCYFPCLTIEKKEWSKLWNAYSGRLSASISFIFSRDERVSPTNTSSARSSRFSSFSARYFDFLDPSHSVFSRRNYYDDLKDIHPWLRRPYSRNSGIALATLQAGPCSIRIDELARPRIKRERLIRQGKKRTKTVFPKTTWRSCQFVFLVLCSRRIFR